MINNKKKIDGYKKVLRLLSKKTDIDTDYGITLLREKKIFKTC